MTDSHIRRNIKMNFNYFSYLCFGWAFVGIVTRILMVGLGDRWNKWEMKSAYKEKNPLWIYIISALGLALVIFTWYQVFKLDVRYSWIIALLISLTLVKISALLFKYNEFRKFASETLNNPKKKMKLTISVFIMSIILIVMGIVLY